MSTTTTTTDIEPVAPAGLAQPDEDPWAGVGDGDTTGDGPGRIPYLGLDRRLDGGFIDSESGEKSQEIDFVWLARGRSRAQWDKPFGAKDAAQAPDCRSFDGIAPDPKSPTPKSVKCEDCPLSQWDGDEPPNCKESVEAMIFLPDPHGFGRLARVRFGGIAVAPARSFWDSFSTRMPRRPPIAYVSKASLEVVDTDNGRFLRPKFERVSELQRSEAQPLIEERDRRLVDWKSDIEDSVSTLRDDATEPAQGGSEPGTYVYAEDEEPF